MIDLTHALEAGIERKEGWGEQKLHVSDLGISPHISDEDCKCSRQFWYRYHGYEREELHAGTRLMFDQGHALEQRAVEALTRGLNSDFRIIATQMDVTPGLPEGFTGTLDILLHGPEGYMVVDVKTRRGGAFRYSNGIRPTNKFQIGGYLYALNNMFDEPVKNGAVLEVDREGQNFARDYHFRYNYDFAAKIQDSFQYVMDLATDDKPPTPLHPCYKVNENKNANSLVVKLPWQCRYCDYRGLSCESAVPPEFDDKLGKVCGHLKDGKFVPREGCEGIEKYVHLNKLTA